MQRFPNTVDSGIVRRLGSQSRSEAEAALSEVYHRYGGFVFGFALRYLGDRAKAEAVTTEVFVCLWENRAAPKASLRGHLVKQAYRRCQRLAPSSPRSGAIAPPGEVIESDGNSGGQNQVNADVDPISCEERLVVDLALFGQLSRTEIAETLGWSEEAVQAHMTEGLRRLADLHA